jgi:hypothetical protein
VISPTGLMPRDLSSYDTLDFLVFSDVSHCTNYRTSEITQGGSTESSSIGGSYDVWIQQLFGKPGTARRRMSGFSSHWIEVQLAHIPARMGAISTIVVGMGCWGYCRDWGDLRTCSSPEK